MPTRQRLRANDRKSLAGPTGNSDRARRRTSDRRSSAGPGPLASQDDQLISQRRIHRLKPPLRLEWRGQRGKNEEDQRDHRANLADSVA